jgi:hypothetical protein
MRSSPFCQLASLPLIRVTPGGCVSGQTNTNPPGGRRAPDATQSSVCSTLGHRRVLPQPKPIGGGDEMIYVLRIKCNACLGAGRCIMAALARARRFHATRSATWLG